MNAENVCPTPGKKSYGTEREANNAISKAWKKMHGGKLPRRAYKCRCNRYHTTSQTVEQRRERIQQYVRGAA